MLNHPYLKLLGLALIIPFFIPFLSKILVYIRILNILTDHYAILMLNQFNQFFNLDLPRKLAAMISLMFWPIVGTILIDLFYRYLLKKTFNQYIICAILLWLFFNCGRFLVH
ncbi:MAG: hypothetical protein EBY16_05340 [Gammaproteobacteria bacterium]|nr:hypothetical protein [Gammaproteobacteria bacterium]